MIETKIPETLSVENSDKINVDQSTIINFLMKLDNNKIHVFKTCPEHVLIPITAFCLLSELDNVLDVIEFILHLELTFNGFILNIEGTLAIAINEDSTDLELLKLNFEKLFEMAYISRSPLPN